MSKTKKDRKKTYRIIGYVFLAISIICFGLLNAINYLEEKTSEAWEYSNELTLKEAVLSEDTELCQRYKQPLRCVILIGMKKNDTKICDSLEDDELNLRRVSCRAIILGDVAYCNKNLKESVVWGCETFYYDILSEIQEENLNLVEAWGIKMPEGI